MTAPVDIALADHRTLLLGMKPAKTYHFRVVARDATMTYTSGDYTVMTGPATTTVSISRFQVMNATARKRGFIVTSYWQGSGHRGAVHPRRRRRDRLVGPRRPARRHRARRHVRRRQEHVDDVGQQQRQPDPADQHGYAGPADLCGHDRIARPDGGQRRDHGVPRIRRDRLRQHLRDRSERNEARDIRIAGRRGDERLPRQRAPLLAEGGRLHVLGRATGRVRGQPRRGRSSGGCRSA